MEDPWNPERRKLGHPASNGRHLRAIPQDIQIGRPGLVLPPRHLPADRLDGYAVGVSGWATGINLGNESEGVTYAPHRNIGIAVFVLGTVQVLALLMRPNKGHRYRMYWNAYHHSVGYAVTVLGVVNVFKGMAILGVEQQWRTAYVAAVFVLGAVAVTLEAVTWGVVVRRRKAEGKTFNNASNGHMPHSV